MIRFTVCAVPIAQPRQRHRVLTVGGRTFAQNFTPAKHPVQSFKATVRLAATEAYKGPPIDGPLSLRLVFVLPRPKRMIWKSRPMPREAHASKPDWDNLGKALADALTGLCWRDDSQISSVQVEKWIAAGDEQPCVMVEIDRA